MAAGRKTGGRVAGTPNRATTEKQMRLAAYVEGGKSGEALPLDIMLKIMRRADAAGDTETALAAAIAAAGYCHPHLTSTQVAMETSNVHFIMADAPMTTEEWCEKYGISYGCNGPDKKPA